ncbi:MAG: iron-sulfur cluster assembly accessory protein [Candidatus Eisenbacteria bacterium]
MLVLTDDAAAQVRKLMERDGREGLKLRLGVAGGGCSGFSYTLTFETGPREKDEVLRFGGLEVLVDPKSAMFLGGMTLDWYDGLDGSGWRFVNPNAGGTCGCGQSFSA